MDTHLSRNRTKRILVALTLLLGILILSEIAARLLSDFIPNPSLQAVLSDYARLSETGPAFRFQPDSDLGYRLTPGYVHETPGGTTRHNAAGFRSDVEFGPKQTGVTRIICLGGSTTYGVTVNANGDTYPAQLEDLLNAGSETFEVFNLGVGGYTSHEVLNNLKRYGLPLEPDIVLIQTAINDVAPRFYPGFNCAYTHFRIPMRPIRMDSFRRILRSSRLIMTFGWALGVYTPLTLQGRTQAPMPDSESALRNLAENGAECFEANLRKMIGACEENGVEVFLLTQPYFDSGNSDIAPIEQGYREGLREHNAAVSSLTLLSPAKLIDLERSMPRERRFFADPIHMTAAGNIEKAALIARAILP